MTKPHFYHIVSFFCDCDCPAWARWLRHLAGLGKERSACSEGQLPGRGTGPDWPALPGKHHWDPKVGWVCAVEGVGIKEREVLGLPAVFLYSSKTSIYLERKFDQVKPTKTSEAGLIKSREWNDCLWTNHRQLVRKEGRFCFFSHSFFIFEPLLFGFISDVCRFPWCDSHPQCGWIDHSHSPLQASNLSSDSRWQWQDQRWGRGRGWS